MTLHILPIVGSKGFHEFAAPFDTHAIENTEYECKAVRRLSDILANNEDPQKDIYEKSGLTEEDYTRDLGEDAYIVSFQSSGGHWLYIPYRYILKYPSVDGVPYRSVMIVVSLPSIPVNQDLSELKAELEDVARTSIGAEVKSKHVDSSKVILVPYELHEQTQVQRNIERNGHMTMTARQHSLKTENQELRTKIQLLEAHILQLRQTAP